MKKYNYDDIEILIADSNRQLRSGLKGVLNQSGFRRIEDVSNLEQMEEAIRKKCPDVLLCDYNLKGGKVCSTIRNLRHSLMGSNPFCSIILFIDEPTQSVVNAASEAGLDDLQIKPIVAQKILDRIKYLVEKRKEFVVTTDYIGPDRRKGHRPDTQEIRSMPVPNSVEQKAKGSYVATEFQEEVDNMVWEINAQKIERHAFQISYLVERILPAYKEGKINRESLGQVMRLINVAKDISRRLEESDYTHLADLVSTLRAVANSLWNSGTEPKRKDLELLPELAVAISATFKSHNDAMADQISASVRQKYKD